MVNIDKYIIHIYDEQYYEVTADNKELAQQKCLEKWKSRKPHSSPLTEKEFKEAQSKYYLSSKLSKRDFLADKKSINKKYIIHIYDEQYYEIMADNEELAQQKCLEKWKNKKPNFFSITEKTFRESQYENFNFVYGLFKRKFQADKKDDEFLELAPCLVSYSNLNFLEKIN